MIEHYVELCGKKGVPPEPQMIVEFERFGKLPPQEDYYPAVSIDEEIMLYSRVLTHAEKIGA